MFCPVLVKLSSPEKPVQTRTKNLHQTYKLIIYLYKQVSVLNLQKRNSFWQILTLFKNKNMISKFFKKAIISGLLFSGLFFFSSPGYATGDENATNKGTTSDQEVTVLTGRRFQTMEGFGTCLVAWRNDMKDIYRTEAFRDQYVYDMGMNILRVNLWGEVLMNEVANPGDISHNNFDKDHARVGVFVDFAKAMQQRTNDVKVIGTVWSPPAWMKYNNNLTDSESSAIAWNDY